jgi:hypothetical protein
MTGERTILCGTTVVDVRDGSLRRAVDITVEGGQIAAITATSDEHPDRVAAVDARGTYAVPGFCDMHAHPLADRRDAEPALRLMLACGVTGFRQMGGSRTLLNDRSAGKLALPIDGPALLSMPPPNRHSQSSHTGLRIDSSSPLSRMTVRHCPGV